jgi:hypothetical protein
VLLLQADLLQVRDSLREVFLVGAAEAGDLDTLREVGG